MYALLRHAYWPATAVLVVANFNATANHRLESGHIEYAKVVHVEPIVRHVDISTPVRECWQEPYQHVETHNDYTTGRTILGGIIGATIGHKIGSGRGKDVATVAGGLAGAAIGANSAANETRQVSHIDYEDRCRTTYQHHQEERIDGYDVTYRFAGKEYTTVMTEKPGDSIPVNVQVRPAYLRPYSH